jgi:hypothetical protein
MRRRVTPILLLVATVGLLLSQQGVFHSSSAQAVKPTPTATTFKLGVTTTPLARNWWRPWQQTDLQSVDTFERDASNHASIVMWYADWQHNSAPLLSQLNAIADRGSVPEITWEPWNASKSLYQPQPRAGRLAPAGDAALRTGDGRQLVPMERLRQRQQAG